MSLPAIAPETAPVIQFDGVSKRYPVRRPAQQRIRDILTGRAPVPEKWALRDVNLAVGKGETIGIVGANGAGKSTLLALVAAASAPTRGTVAVRGRVSALLELSAGFHPEWTGRENAEFQIRLRGHGRRDARRMLEEVEAFADIGAQFDQPLRTCSTGMALRVAFAAAVCVDPDILIVDEALAVGDAAFQHKCFRKLGEFNARGTTILLVTHRLDIVPQLCSRALLLDGGRVTFDGAPGEMLARYARSQFPSSQGREAGGGRGSGEAAGSAIGERFGEGGAAIESVGVPGGVLKHRTGDLVRFDVRVRFDEDVERPLLGFSLRTVEDVVLYTFNSDMAGTPMAPARAGEERVVRIEMPLRLASGTFFADFSIWETDAASSRVLDARSSHVRIDVEGRSPYGGIIDLEARMSLHPAASPPPTSPPGLAAS